MARLTKAGIETALIGGKPVTWNDQNGKAASLVLRDPRERRLFEFLLKSSVRDPTGLPEAFTFGLQSAYAQTDDPAAKAVQSASSSAVQGGPWRLHSINTEGFGGLNTWKGSEFNLQLEQQSFLLEGPNGSGKSSLVGAVVWAMTGERPRDQADVRADDLRPVLGADEKSLGEWPPIACYPPELDDLKSPPSVRVELEFRNPSGGTARIERKLSGGVSSVVMDAALAGAEIIVEAGVLMPARLARLRFDSGGGQLTAAIQKLTGLDDLIAIGSLAEGLCHKAREYRAYRVKEHTQSKAAFDAAIERARLALNAIGESVPSFAPPDAKEPTGPLATFAKGLSERAAELAGVISSDLSRAVDLANASQQNQIIASIEIARQDLALGLPGVSSWARLQLIHSTLQGSTTNELREVLSSGTKEIEEALVLVAKAAADPKFQLKALAARWHSKHHTGPIVECPVCEQDLAQRPALAVQLEELRTAGDAAARTFEDNINSIATRVEATLPDVLRALPGAELFLDPRQQLIDGLTKKFVAGDRYAEGLVKFAALVEANLSAAPTENLEPASFLDGQSEPEPLKALRLRIRGAERLLELGEWFDRNSNAWSDWWRNLAEPRSSAGSREPESAETLSEHLTRLSDALAKAEPFRHGAQALTDAIAAGQTAAAYEAEISKREAVVEALTPLKALGGLAEAVARDAINDLSGRISTLLDEFLLAERFKFGGTHIRKKEGLLVRGSFNEKYKIDATLVANTSWLRAVLWCFLFSLRDEAVEQIGSDPLPLMVFDDPQATFDVFHRARWARHIAEMQGRSTPLQVVIATYDEQFLELVKADGVTGREAIISAPGAAADRVTILEGAAIERAWAAAQQVSTPKAGVDYIADVRVHTEGFLKLMLRGEEAKVRTMVLGDLRDLLNRLHDNHKAPWDRPAFKNLLKFLDKGRPEIKYLEGSHHSTGQNYGMVEAAIVEKAWRGLSNALERAFKMAREHQLLHGQLNALHAQTPVATLPEGYQEQVKRIPINIIGRAAALTNGRTADGHVAMAEFEAGNRIAVVLGKHSAYRVTAPTLEPVARPGDIVLVKEHADATSKSLVVALSDDRVLARRLEISDNHSDIAVLTAQAINPHRIAAPVVAHRSTFVLKKIIGILYDTRPPPPVERNEVCDCGGEAALRRLTTGTLGLVEVVGDSAEPHALDGQFLVVGGAVTSPDELKRLDGRPVIAADEEGNCYFKRLRNSDGTIVVLESLESGGDFPPVLLSVKPGSKNSLKTLWPVAGVLFERS